MEDREKTGYALNEVLKAQGALREAAGLEPETFPLPAFIGMISDEIDALREKGIDDDGIAALICDHSAIQVTSQEIHDHYAPTDARSGHPGR